MAKTTKSRILVVDDEKYICNIIVEALGRESFEVLAFSDPTEALDYIGSHRVDLVLTDLVMGKHSGVEILEQTLANHPDAIVILMTAHPTVQAAISVLKKGAHDFLVKPFKLELLRAAIRRGLEHQQVRRENIQLKGQVNFLENAVSICTVEERDSFMAEVIAACRKELSAQSAVFIELDDNGRVVNSLSENDNGLTRLILSSDVIDKLLSQRYPRQLTRSTTVTVDDHPVRETLISQPIVVQNHLRGVINLLVHTRFAQIPPGQLNLLSIFASSAGSALTNYELYSNLRNSYMQAIRALANAIEARDAYTAGHTDRVCRLAELIARELEWSQPDIDNLIMGCTLHDIGKIGVPDSILNKPGQLSNDEYERMLNHPHLGLKIISGIDLFRPAIPYIMGHHERYDGSGYPHGLKGEQIPVEGRLLAVADTFDAILSDRPYRKGRSLKVAVEELVNNAGKQFDPDIVRTFIKVVQSGQVDFEEMYGRTEDLASIIDDDATATEDENQTAMVTEKA